MRLLAHVLGLIDAKHLPAYLESTNPLRHGQAPAGHLTESCSADARTARCRTGPPIAWRPVV